MTRNPTTPLLVLALLAVVVAAATWPPTRTAGRLAFDKAADAYQTMYFDSQSFRFLCM